MIGGRNMKKGEKDGFANSDATFEMIIDYIMEKRILNKLHKYAKDKP